MWQSKREISRECNDIIGSAKGTTKWTFLPSLVPNGLMVSEETKRKQTTPFVIPLYLLLFVCEIPIDEKTYNWVSERITNKRNILRRIGEGVKGRCLPWSKEEEGAYIFWMNQVPVGEILFIRRYFNRILVKHHMQEKMVYCCACLENLWF
jgi:hypothetical protein